MEEARGSGGTGEAPECPLTPAERPGPALGDSAAKKGSEDDRPHSGGAGRQAVPPPATPLPPATAPAGPVAQGAGLAGEKRVDPWLDVWAHVRPPGGWTAESSRAEIER